jgi:hypothetical protein
MEADLKRSKEFKYASAFLAAELIPNYLAPEPERSINWENLYGLLSSQRLAAYFYSLRKKYRKIWPNSFIERLRFDHYAYLIYGDQCISQIRTLLSALKKNDIPIIVLKGWTLIQMLYEGDYSCRFCEDIDLLIDPKDFDRAEKVIQNLGYRGSEEVWPGHSYRYKNERIFLSPKGKGLQSNNFVVSLHWGLFHNPSYDPKLIDMKELFGNAEEIKIADQPVLMLSIEDQVVYMSAHLGLHHRHFQSLAHFFEIADIIYRNGKQLDWHKLANQADKWKCAIQVKTALKRVEALWPGIIPAHGMISLEFIKPSAAQIIVDRWIEKSSDNKMSDILLEVFTIPGWRKKMFLVLEQAFPSGDYMRSRYKNICHNNLFFLYLYRFYRAFQSALFCEK